jgi:hypothetical protein
MKDQHIFHFNVSELIELLKLFPGDMPVLVDGCEDGYENFNPPFIVKVVYQPENPYFSGAFQHDDQGKEVLVLKREYRDD